MPDPIICPHCREQLDIPAEYHGRQVRCASCQNVFVAVAEGEMPVARPLPGRSNYPDQPRPAHRPADEHDDRPPRRSNVGVVLALLLVVLTVGGCCGGLNLMLVIQTNPTVSPYTSAEGKFKVEFPAEGPAGAPIAVGGDDKAGESGWQVTGNRASANERYTIRCYDLKPEWRKLSEADALDAVAKAELTAHAVPDPNPKTERTTHAKFTALDVKASQGSGLNQTVTVMRCILAGKRVYVVSVQGPQGIHQSWWVRQYFLSFEITDPTAKPPKDEEPKKEKKQD